MVKRETETGFIVCHKCTIPPVLARGKPPHLSGNASIDQLDLGIDLLRSRSGFIDERQDGMNTPECFRQGFRVRVVDHTPGQPVVWASGRFLTW